MSDSVFSYKTKGGSSPENKSKIYFTCHPDDFEFYFESVCNDIFEFQDCVIFYTEDMSADLGDENTLVDLERMNLFVVPVTFKLLTTGNRTMNFDFMFAKEKHIPVLPLIMESSILEFYSKPDKFGELQYLKPYDTDLTSISFKDKLKKYLDSVLISDELIEEIKKAFDAYIFLSYRKKDRKHANDLMKLIHKIPEFEDLAIWFDEFLTPGESFRTNIYKVLSDSKLFALLVTPNLLERRPDGTPNFIMKEEYPAAREMGKTILPAEMENTDEDMLKKEYEGIPDCVFAGDEDALFKRLMDSLSGIVRTDNDDDPEHNFLIGLAYLKGIDVEKDIDRGLRLITKAAEADYPEAMRLLVDMYANGDNVQINLKESLKWAKRLYLFCESNYKDEDEYIYVCKNNLAHAYLAVGNIKKAIELLEECYEMVRKTFGENQSETLNVLSNLALVYESAGDYKLSIELSEKCYEMRKHIFGQEHPDTLNSLNNLACSYSERGEIEKALEMLEQCYELCKIYYGEEHPNTLICLNNLATLYRENNDVQKSLELDKKCYILNVKVLGEYHPSTLMSLCNLALSYKKAGDISMSLKLNKKCYKLRTRILGESHPDTLTSLNNLSIAYVRSGDVNRSFELAEKCYELSKTVLGLSHPNTFVYSYSLLLMCLKKGNKAKVFELLEERYEPLVSESGTNPSAILVYLPLFAKTYYRYGSKEKGIILYQKYYNLCLKAFGEDDSRTIKALDILRKMQSDEEIL